MRAEVGGLPSRCWERKEDAGVSPEVVLRTARMRWEVLRVRNWRAVSRPMPVLLPDFHVNMALIFWLL